jgi:hypothetical protein
MEGDFTLLIVPSRRVGRIEENVTIWMLKIAVYEKSTDGFITGNA